MHTYAFKLSCTFYSCNEPAFDYCTHVTTKEFLRSFTAVSSLPRPALTDASERAPRTVHGFDPLHLQPAYTLQSIHVIAGIY